MVATEATQPRPVNTKFGFVVATAVGDDASRSTHRRDKFEAYDVAVIEDAANV